MKLLSPCGFMFSVLLLELCEAQFFPGGFGATQNCANSQCNQNNFGRKKREIVSELISLAEETQDEFDNKIDDELTADIELDRETRGFHFLKKLLKKNKDKRKKHFHGKKRAIADAIVSLAEEVASVEATEAFNREKREAEAQLQNCQGSSCNQNNVGSVAPVPVPVAPVLIPAPVPVLPPNPAIGIALPPNPALGLALPPNPALGLTLPLNPAFAVGGFGAGAGATQNCLGSSCNQNNFGRKKRAVLQALLDEADKITEEDFEPERLAALAEDIQGDSSNSQIPSFLRELFLLPEAELELKFSASSKSSELISTPENAPVHIVECSGPSSSFCENTLCRVQCSDGTKVGILLLKYTGSHDLLQVELECTSNSVVVKTTSVSKEASLNEVSCG